MNEDEPYTKIINESEYTQLRLSISRFRGIEYVSLREYFLDFDGEWYPSKKGITSPLDLDTITNLFVGMAEILSLAESREVIENFFGDIIRDIYLGE